MYEYRSMKPCMNQRRVRSALRSQLRSARQQATPKLTYLKIKSSNHHRQKIFTGFWGFGVLGFENVFEIIFL